MVLSMDRWIDKVCIVTGASSGIGAAVAERLVIEGLVVVGLARRIDKMEEMARNLFGKRGVLHPIKCDMSNEKDIKDAFHYIKENVGPVHVLINNAGTAKLTNLMDGDTHMWKEIIDINILGLCIATREAVRDMKRNNVNGHIIHMNSIAGHMVFPNMSLNVYPASKFAVTALTETLRFEFNNINSKIKVTSVSPGMVDTELFEASGASMNMVKSLLGGNLPLLKPEDVADGIVYILSTPPHVQVTELTIKPVNESI